MNKEQVTRMTPSQLKVAVESRDTESHFFTRKTMQFFGDTMRNYAVNSKTIVSNYNKEGKYIEGGIEREVWELRRKKPVKHGLKDSAYFCKETFERVYEKQ